MQSVFKGPALHSCPHECSPKTNAACRRLRTGAVSFVCTFQLLRHSAQVLAARRMGADTTSPDLAGLDAQSLPPVVISFASHNEDGPVEMDMVATLASAKLLSSAEAHVAKDDASTAGLRVLYVSGCGSHAIAMAASPHVKTIDAVDLLASQVQTVPAQRCKRANLASAAPALAMSSGMPPVPACCSNGSAMYCMRDFTFAMQPLTFLCSGHLTAEPVHMCRSPWQHCIVLVLKPSTPQKSSLLCWDAAAAQRAG